MSEQKKLDRWADKLLDTGKRNNLINFKDTKTSTAEIIYPDGESIFSKCSIGHVFNIFDPKIPDLDTDESDDVKQENADNEKLSRDEFKARYIPRIKSERFLLAYAQIPNPITAVKNIAKKAQEMQDETGINVAYLAFGFLKWKEKESSEIFFRAPLLLVHVNVLNGSIQDSVRIEISDDDVIVNPTFGFFLQAEYGMTLPDYEDGDSLSSYYLKVDYAVRRMGWEIVDECKLGIFSFLKINMYEDLKKNASQILGNDNVRALLGENAAERVGIYDDESIHTVANPLIDLHTVVDADSSQIEAIEMAKSGRSFVLQGPPGTGKSQTITNIIAECLHDGKKVLFVSEKQAALNVVFDKLKKVGLAEFCLELHSHKANKKLIIDDLNRTLESRPSSVSPNAQEEIRQKKEAQSKLDAYASALHEKRKPIDLSLYQLFERYSATRLYPEVPFSVPNIQTKGLEYQLHAVHLLEQYAEYITSIGQDYRKNAWYGFTDTQLSFEGYTQLKADLEQLVQSYQTLQDTTFKIKEKYETPEMNFSDTQRWRSLLLFSSESDVITPSILSREALNYALPYLEQMKVLSETILPVKNTILEKFDAGIIQALNGKVIHSQLTGQFSSFFSRLFSREYRNLMKEIKNHTKNGKKMKYRQAVELTDQLGKLQTVLDNYHEQEASIHGCLGSCYHGPDTDWTHVMSELETLKGFFSENALSFGLISRMSSESFAENQKMFLKDSEELSQEMNTVNESKDRLSKQFSPEILNFDEHSYNDCIIKANKCLEQFDSLRHWISFSEVLTQLKEIGLTSFVDLIIDRQVESKNITGCFQQVFYKQWIEYILFSVSELATFSRVKQDQAVRDFIKKDNLQYEINKAQIRSELSQQRPNPDLVAGGSAAAILRREAFKKRKQMPIRKLLSETGSLVQILKPCFLMSPLSVSTFLDPEKLRFDTVIFDEASQIFPQDAIGAIYRGKQLIVVGDSRQMPPSNFFNNSSDIDDDDEEIGDINDFESILDVCSSVFTTERLAWHYRSHYEQLIAFSNLSFYDNKLVTFPSSTKDHEGIGVDYYHVDGTFDRTSKTNKVEAQFIVDLIYQHIQEHPDRSLGVVAFSVAQQSLIDKLLSKQRETDPSQEWFFKSDNAEPFFIKNLETVQGDERDTIIFSIAYARDAQGRFVQNFGPLNRKGGERRLNVAVTRAKDNIQVVASIHYTDIDLSKTGSEGVRLLRAYLDFAQNGEQALERTITASSEDHFDSDFEMEVCEYLRDQGFTVDTQVGCAGYRIDLGLRKPDSSHYLLAIECDGATYHSSKNARDRDSLRQQILENMGWQFYRIWSTDWYRNKMVEKTRLLESAKTAFNRCYTQIEPSRKAVPTAEEETHESFVIETPKSKAAFSEYRQLDAMRVIKKHGNSLQGGILEILKTEAPLSEEYLLKRIVNYFDRQKVTKVVLEEYQRKMYKCEARGIVRKNGFLYLQEMNKIRFRIPGDRREIKYISTEEISDGLRTLIQQNVMVSRDGLYKTMSNLLGFNRTGDAIIDRFEEALTYLKKKNLIQEENGFLSIKKY